MGNAMRLIHLCLPLVPLILLVSCATHEVNTNDLPVFSPDTPKSGKCAGSTPGFYYDYPSDVTWDDVYNLTVMPYGHINTVWQAVSAIDATFPTRGPCVDAFGQRLEPWPRIPSPELFRQAMIFATH